MAERIDVPVAEFAFTGKGNYVWKADRRELFQIVHPWVASKAGDFGQMETQVAVPAEAEPPFTLVFYVTDNNYTGPEDTGADWINRKLRVGHWFRQALVNGEIVWLEDTSLDDTSQHYLVDVSGKVKPGQPFRLAFRGSGRRRTAVPPCPATSTSPSTTPPRSPRPPRRWRRTVTRRRATGATWPSTPVLCRNRRKSPGAGGRY